MKKKVFIIVPILIIIIIFSLIFYPVNKNNKYENKMKENIIKSTDIKNIIYLNKDNNYYIVKTKEKVYVLDLNYDIKKELDSSKLLDSNKKIVYQRGNLYYEEKIKQKNKLIYKFYDITNGDLVYESSVGGGS